MKRRVVVYLLGSVLLGILFSFCNKPREVLSRKSMEKLMYDIYIAEAMIDNDYRNFDTPEKKEALISEVFKKHRITQARWDTSLSWYSDKVDIYLKMNDSVKARLQRHRQASERIMNRQLAQEQAASQRSYLSAYIPPNYSFSEVNPQNGFRFRLDSAEIDKKIAHPNFHFSFNVIGIPSNTTPNLKTWLMLEYKDTTIYCSQSISENKNYLLHGQKYIADDTIRSITGFVRLQDTIGIYRNVLLNNIILSTDDDSVRINDNDTTLLHQPTIIAEQTEEAQELQAPE